MSDLLSRRKMLSVGTAGALAGVGLAVGSTAQAAAATCPGAMSQERYKQYVDLFNANDPRFIEFYHPEVVLELGNATLRGPQAIRDFYKEVKAHIHEKVEFTKFISDPTGIAVELPSEFKVYKDWPEPNYFRRPLKAGEVFRIISFGMYWVEDGKFRQIKSSRYKLVNDWRMEG